MSVLLNPDLARLGTWATPHTSLAHVVAVEVSEVCMESSVPRSYKGVACKDTH